MARVAAAIVRALHVRRIVHSANAHAQRTEFSWDDVKQDKKHREHYIGQTLHTANVVRRSAETSRGTCGLRPTHTRVRAAHVQQSEAKW